MVEEIAMKVQSVFSHANKKASLVFNAPFQLNYIFLSNYLCNNHSSVCIILKIKSYLVQHRSK